MSMLYSTERLMKKMIILASDFDGTLYQGAKNGSFLPGDIEAIQNFQKNGNLFGVCTGRPLNAILDATSDRISYDFYIITSGAIILDKERNILFQKCLTHHVLQKILDLYQDQCAIVVQADSKIYSFYSANGMPAKQEIIYSPDELKDTHIHGISMMCDNEKQAQSISQRLIQQLPNEIRAFQNIQYVDIVAEGCSKGTGMDFLKHQLPNSLLGGIGDSYNDEPLLKSADVAFTFHHSPKQIQQYCDHLVANVAEAIHIMEHLSSHKVKTLG